MGVILSFLTAGVQFLLQAGIFPLIGLFVEPAKVLFLNNAINHGIFTPLGAEQVAESGKSIFYMIEPTPPRRRRPLSLLVIRQRQDDSPIGSRCLDYPRIRRYPRNLFPVHPHEPGPSLSHHRRQRRSLFYNMIFDLGLSGPPAPGSLISYLAMAPKGSTLAVILSIVIATVVSFLIASPIIKLSNAKSGESLEESTAEDAGHEAASKNEATTTTAQVDLKHITNIVFACDAGMGSSAMGAAVLQKKFKKAGLTDITVSHASVSEVPADAQLVVCHKDLADRAKASAPNARLITITNFMAAPEYGMLVDELAAARNEK